MKKANGKVVTMNDCRLTAFLGLFALLLLSSLIATQPQAA